MYVYKQTEYALWTVGFYANGQFHPESEHNTPNEAANRVHWLNGSNEVRIRELENRIEEIEMAIESINNGGRRRSMLV